MRSGIRCYSNLIASKWSGHARLQDYNYKWWTAVLECFDHFNGFNNATKKHCAAKSNLYI